MKPRQNIMKREGETKALRTSLWMYRGEMQPCASQAENLDE